MKIKLLVIGKTEKNYLIEGEKDYEKRLSHYCKLSELTIPDIKNRAKFTKNELKIKEVEAKALLMKYQSVRDAINSYKNEY